MYGNDNSESPWYMYVQDEVHQGVCVLRRIKTFFNICKYVKESHAGTFKSKWSIKCHMRYKICKQMKLIFDPNFWCSVYIIYTCTYTHVHVYYLYLNINDAHAVTYIHMYNQWPHIYMYIVGYIHVYHVLLLHTARQNSKKDTSIGILYISIS